MYSPLALVFKSELMELVFRAPCLLRIVEFHNVLWNRIGLHHSRPFPGLSIMPLVIWINDWVSIFIFMLFFLFFFVFLLRSLKNHKATKQCLYFLMLYKASLYKIQKNCTLTIQVASFQPETLSFNELAPFLLAAGFFIGSGGLFPFVLFFFMPAFGLALAFAFVAGMFFCFAFCLWNCLFLFWAIWFIFATLFWCIFFIFFCGCRPFHHGSQIGH